MKHCTDVREKLPLFVGRDLDPETERFVREHLAGCTACAERAEAARSARDVLVRSLRPDPADLRAGLWEAIRAELVAEGRLGGRPTAASIAAAPAPARPARRLRLLPRLVGGVAVAAALVAGIALGPRFLEGSAPASSEHGAPGVVVPVTPAVADASELPPDPSTMGLRPGEVRLRPVFGTSLLERSRTLRNEAILVPAVESSGPNQLAGHVGTGRIVR